MHERIRELRKKHLHLTQSEFGERLGVSRAVIKNIELNVLAKPEQKLSLIKLMCKEFSVNEDWLLNGIEPIFVQPDSFSLDQFAKEHGCTELELEIMKAYFELDQGTRLAVVNHFKERLTSAKNHRPLDDAASADSPAVPTLAPVPPPAETPSDPIAALTRQLAELERQNQEIMAQNQELSERLEAIEQEDEINGLGGGIAGNNVG